MPNPRTAAEWALRAVESVDRHFDSDERLRVGRDLDPTYRRLKLAELLVPFLDAFARQQVEEDHLSRRDYLRGPCPAHGLNFSLCHDCHDLLVRQQVEAAKHEAQIFADEKCRHFLERATKAEQQMEVFRERAVEAVKLCQMPSTPDTSPLVHQGMKTAKREIAAAIRALT